MYKESCLCGWWILLKWSIFEDNLYIFTGSHQTLSSVRPLTLEVNAASPAGREHIADEAVNDQQQPHDDRAFTRPATCR